jgi:hypothetical protein
MNGDERGEMRVLGRADESHVIMTNFGKSRGRGDERNKD